MDTQKLNLTEQEFARLIAKDPAGGRAILRGLWTKHLTGLAEAGVSGDALARSIFDCSTRALCDVYGPEGAAASLRATADAIENLPDPRNQKAKH